MWTGVRYDQTGSRRIILENIQVFSLDGTVKSYMKPEPNDQLSKGQDDD